MSVIPHTKHFSCEPRTGSVLIFVLIVTASVVSLASLSISFALSRRRTEMRLVCESELRRAAVSALSDCAWLINADTNEFDCLLEPWNSPVLDKGVSADVLPENSRLCFQYASQEELTALFAYMAPEDLRERAADSAVKLSAWWEKEKTVNSNRVLRAAEELFDAEDADPEILAAALPSLTVFGDGKVNINTALPEVLYCIFAGAGADYKTAGLLAAKIVKARESGLFFEKIDAASAAALLTACGEPLLMAERDILIRTYRRFTTSSMEFRITSDASMGGESYTVQCVFERGTPNRRRWAEW